jgi:hypothetical protein
MTIDPRQTNIGNNAALQYQVQSGVSFDVPTAETKIFPSILDGE